MGDHELSPHELGAYGLGPHEPGGDGWSATLLPKRALGGIRVGLSVSGSADLGRLGLLEEHFRLALAEITRAVLVLGGHIIYGGHLQADGHTSVLVTELQRYARLVAGQPEPLLLCLAWQEHRRVPLPDLTAFAADLALLGRLVCLDVDGNEVDPATGRGDEPAAVDESVVAQALTRLRVYMAQRQDGRVLIGGRRQQFQGVVPGLVEEAHVALSMNQPIYLAGGFGGATLDIALALGLDDGSWLPREPADYVDGYHLIQAMARRPGWSGLNNGLTADENRWLAASHRPSDIAALVSVGLGRLAVKR